jgi:hypothetical protein
MRKVIKIEESTDPDPDPIRSGSGISSQMSLGGTVLLPGVEAAKAGLFTH